MASHAQRMPGKGHLTLTAHLGDVMRESAQIAYSYVRSKALEFGIGADVFATTDVHVPAGAIPKDGPSAGVAMVTAMVSLLTARPVRHAIGMTGEITLRGRVLPVGGVKWMREERAWPARHASLAQDLRNGHLVQLGRNLYSVFRAVTYVKTTLSPSPYWRAPAVSSNGGTQY